MKSLRWNEVIQEMNEQEFLPDWTSAPGETILDILEERRLSTNDLAIQLNQTQDFVKGLIVGQERITLDVANQLAKVFGVSADFWVNREAKYRADSARLGKKQ